jgi:hypothetical protein
MRAFKAAFTALPVLGAGIGWGETDCPIQITERCVYS